MTDEISGPEVVEAHDADADIRRRAELWAGARRQERLFARGIGVLCALGTLYFGAANAYLIFKAQAPPLQLSFERPAGTDARYLATIAWHALEGGKRPVRPVLRLAGVQIPETGAMNAEGAEISLSEAQELRIDVPREAAPGDHRGDLVLTRAGGDLGVPQTLSAPISIEVTAGFWTSWFLLRDWFILAFVLGAIGYIACVVVFPVPSGKLIFAVIRDGSVRTGRVALSRHPLALFLPWLRSSLPLAYLGRLAGLPQMARMHGQIEFQFPGLPLLLVEGASAGSQVRQAPGSGGAVEELDASEFRPASPIVIMYDAIFSFGRQGDSEEVRIQYLKEIRGS